MKFRFTATLNRPQGSRVFKGNMNGCRHFPDALFVARELLLANDAFEPEVSSLKITISPLKSNKKP